MCIRKFISIKKVKDCLDEVVNFRFNKSIQESRKPQLITCLAEYCIHKSLKLVAALYKDCICDMCSLEMSGWRMLEILTTALPGFISYCNSQRP